jgi:hypothetical protein
MILTFISSNNWDYQLVNHLLVTKQHSYFSGLNHLIKTEKALLQNIKEENDKDKEQQQEDIEQQPTTNGVF